MKTVVYTNGDPHDHVLYGVYQVPDEMTKERHAELYQEFIAKYYPDAEKRKLRWGFTRIEADVHHEYIKKQSEILSAEGCDGWDETSWFLSWLCKNHGWQEIPYEEWA